MIKIEANTLETAYEEAASKLECSITELSIEVIQHPKSGFLGFFKKSAIIVATCKAVIDDVKEVEPESNDAFEEVEKPKKTTTDDSSVPKKVKATHHEVDDTILPNSFVTTQEDDEYSDEEDYSHYQDDAEDDFFQNAKTMEEISLEVKEKINALFTHVCFKLNEINVSVYDENTLHVEFSGDDAALLIGKEGYRYKALSYIIFNWINAEYQVQLRMEIAEFLQNQEESVSRYLVSVCENIERDGRAQTKVLDGVLVQIALKELRSKYPQKYVAIRSTRDGAKYIIINDYNEH